MKMTKDAQVGTQSVNIKIDPVVKDSAEAALSNMGINMSTYIVMCLREVAQSRKVPFTPSADPAFWADEQTAYKVKRMVESDFLVFATIFIPGAHAAMVTLTIEIGKHIDSAGTRDALLVANTLGGMKLQTIWPHLDEAAKLFEDQGVPSPIIKAVKEAADRIDELFNTVFSSRIIDESGIVDNTFPGNTWDDLDKGQRYFAVGTALEELSSAYEKSPDSMIARFTGRQATSSSIQLIQNASSATKLFTECLSSFNKNASGNMKKLIEPSETL